MGAPIYSNDRFVDLLKFSPQQAFEYRLETQGTPIPETFGEIILDVSKNTAVSESAPSLPSEEGEKEQEGTKEGEIDKKGGEIDPPKTETDEKLSETGNESEKSEPSGEETLTREKMVSLLKDAGIKFFAGAKDDKLLEICKNNNLV